MKCIFQQVWKRLVVKLTSIALWPKSCGAEFFSKYVPWSSSPADNWICSVLSVRHWLYWMEHKRLPIGEICVLCWYSQNMGIHDRLSGRVMTNPDYISLFNILEMYWQTIIGYYGLFSFFTHIWHFIGNIGVLLSDGEVEILLQQYDLTFYI